MIKKLVILMVASLFLALAGCSDEDSQKQDTAAVPVKIPPLPVEFITAQKENIPIWLEYTGKTEASKRIEVRARVAGRLEKVLFKEGDNVKKGQPLFVIEKTSYEVAVDQAKAKLELDRASLKLARADVDRYKPLVTEGLAPRITLEQNEARVQELEATIKADKAALREADLNLSYTDVVSPIDGRISLKQVDVGNIVGYGEKTLLTTIVFDDPMLAYFNPTEEAFQIMLEYRSREVLDARVRIPSKLEKLLNRGTYTGNVDFSDNRVDRMTGTITMRAKVNNDKHDLLEGSFVYVDVFITDEVPFLMVPPNVVQEDQLGSFLYVVDEDNKAKRVDIQRGFEGRHYLMVKGGLDDGARVVISGLAKVKPGLALAPTDVSAEKGIMANMRKRQMVPEKE